MVCSSPQTSRYGRVLRVGVWSVEGSGMVSGMTTTTSSTVLEVEAEGELGGGGTGGLFTV